jgi:hypothetical protein
MDEHVSRVVQINVIFLYIGETEKKEVFISITAKLTILKNVITPIVPVNLTTGLLPNLMRYLPAVDVSTVISGIFFCKARTCLSPAINTPAAPVSGIIPLKISALWMKKSVYATLELKITAFKSELDNINAELVIKI